jgi:MFS family permease
MAVEQNASIGTAAADRWTPAAGWSLGFLTLIAMFNYLDRSLLGLVLPLIKADLQLSDTALGLSSGLAFAVFYSLLGVPIASLADRSNRRNIIAVGFGFWSLMTVVTGWVANGWQLAFCRFLMGAGEAASLAPSQSMIADRFSPARRPLALSIFTASSALNSLMFMPIAGWTAATYGWRAAFHLAGLAGLILAGLFYLTVREPERRYSGIAPPAAVPMLQAIRTLARLPAYLWLLGGGAFMGGGLYASATWLTTMLVRVHGFSIVEVASIITPLGGIAGALGIVATGWLADRLGRRDIGWRLWVPAGVCFLCVPAYLAFLLGDIRWVWGCGLGVVFALQAAYQGPTFAAVISMAPESMRAVSISIMVLFTGLVGQIFGPLIVGMLSDALAASQGVNAIRYSMLVVALCTLLGGTCFLMASRYPGKQSPDI